MYDECRHIMPSGRKCHSPALRNLPYCYYHQNLHRYGNPANPDKLAVFPIEDVRGIQIALTQVLASLNSPYMDTRRAGLLLCGLQIAAQLVKQAPALEPGETVRTFEESTGIALAPEKSVCEPPTDCRNCPRKDTCEKYEEPEEDEEEEEEEQEQSEDSLDEENDDYEEDQNNNEEVFAANEAALIKKAKSLLEDPPTRPTTRSVRQHSSTAGGNSA